MREAVLTASPKRQYRGFRSPTTEPRTAPVCIPMRILKHPFRGSFGSRGITETAATTSCANFKTCAAWSSCGGSRFPTQKYASPMVSTLKRRYLVDRASIAEKSLSIMAMTSWGGRLDESSV